MLKARIGARLWPVFAGLMLGVSVVFFGFVSVTTPRSVLAQDLAADPIPQTPQPVGSVYDPSMTPGEVQAECLAGGQRWRAEYHRLLANAAVYQISHPDYYAAERQRLIDWFKQTEATHNRECQEQMARAWTRQAPPGLVLPEIRARFSDAMTLAEVEVLCTDVARLIEQEYWRLIDVIALYQTSHPGYYERESARINDWYAAHSLRHENQCEARRNRFQGQDDIDALYPDVPREIKDLAAQLQLTDIAKRILYENDPRIVDDAGHPDFNCAEDVVTETYIYGCWSASGTIRVLRDNSMLITLAHELLHAVYHELYRNHNVGDLNRQIDLTVTWHPEQAQLILDAYADQLSQLNPASRRYLRYTEMHSFIGTQFGDIPPALEAYYAQYFKDRRVILNIFYEWVVDTRAKLQERQAAYDRLLDQAAQYQKCLADATTEACSDYQPDENAYAAYDQCLQSNLTFLADCQYLRPLSVVYVKPADRDDLADPEDGGSQQIEGQVQDLIDRVSQQQAEAEDSFVSQLASQDHDFEPVDSPETPSPPVSSMPDGDQIVQSTQSQTDEPRDEPAEAGPDDVVRPQANPPAGSQGSPAADSSDKVPVRAALLWLAAAGVLPATALAVVLMTKPRRR